MLNKNILSLENLVKKKKQILKRHLQSWQQKQIMCMFKYLWRAFSFSWSLLRIKHSYWATKNTWNWKYIFFIIIIIDIYFFWNYLVLIFNMKLMNEFKIIWDIPWGLFHSHPSYIQNVARPLGVQVWLLCLKPHHPSWVI